MSIQVFIGTNDYFFTKTSRGADVTVFEKCGTYGSGSCSRLPGSGAIIVLLLVSAAGRGHLSRKDRVRPCRALCERGHYLLQSARTPTPPGHDRTSFGSPTIHDRCKSFLPCLCSECRDRFSRSIHGVFRCELHLQHGPSFA